jgi:hypothetical protein
MASTRKTTAVRVERPRDASLADFFANMRSWLDHQCIMPAEFRGVTLANKGGVFDVLFDNPRDALLFGRRFAAQSARNVSLRRASLRPINATTPPVDPNRGSILAAVAGDANSVLWTRPKLYQSA